MSACCNSLNYSCVLVDGKVLVFSHKNVSFRGRKIGNFQVSPYGYMVTWKKWIRPKWGLCLMRNSSEVLLGNGNFKNSLSSDEVSRVLKSNSDPKSAFAYFESVSKLPNVVHTIGTCNHMLEVLRVHNMFGEMRFVFDFMQKQIIMRDLDTYLTIFKSLDIRGGIRQAPVGLERMRDVGFVLNAYSYIGLIHLLLQSGFFREALQIYRRMVSEGLKPSLKTYSALMVASGKRRDTRTVMDLLEEMESLGLKPNVYTFTICIRVLGRAGKIDKAFGILKRMDDMRCEPDVVTYTVLIDALCNAGRLDQAKEIFVKMKASSHKPDRITYIILLDKFSDRGDLELVKEFWNEMEADGYAPEVEKEREKERKE